VLAAIAAACTSATKGVSVNPTTSASASTPTKALPLGLYESDNQLDYTFPVQYSYAIQYYGWWEGFQSAEALNAWHRGITTFAELQTCGDPCDSKGVPIRGVMDGLYDSYLRSFAEAVKAFHHPVLMTFDHEMNGGWYPWGHGKTSAKQWIAAWQYVTSRISAIAPNVRWVWAPNVEDGAASFNQYWPGIGYANPHVDLVGLDGYLIQGSTWANTFAPSVVAIQALAGGKYPFMVTETGVSATDTNSVAQIDDLVAGARSANSSALMYFNMDAQGVWSLTAAERSELIKKAAS
jgi:hypothetical protein